MTADEFTSAMLVELRKEFFTGVHEKQFHQEKHVLMQAITYPARYINERGAVAIPSKYREILGVVITAIKKHGRRAQIDRFSVYFLHCVQAHMKHHGDDYYQDAKAARPIGSVVDRTIQKLRNQEAFSTTDALSQAHRALSIRAGRKKAQAPKQPELFAS